jgi:hypothetical protein
MKRRLVLFLILSIFSSAFVLPKTAHAIPAFARKYNVPCSLCHVAFPKLNDFGNTFRDNGYQMGTDVDLPEKHDEGFWPIAFRTTVGYQAATITNQTKLDHTLGRGRTGGVGFTGLDILSFGTLARDISYSVVYTPFLEGAGFDTGSDVADSNLESAWVRFDNLFHTSLLNLKIGKFEIDVPFSEKRSVTLNTPYVVYHYTSGSPYSVNLANDSNLGGLSNVSDFGLGDNQSGLELAGHSLDRLGTFRYSLSLLSNAELHSDPFGGGGRQFQFYGHVTQSFGGWGATSGQRIGVFGFYGKAPTQNEIPSIQGNGSSDQTFSRVGGDVSLNYASLNLLLVYMHGSENKNLFCAPDTTTGLCSVPPNAQDASWNGGFFEANYMVNLDLMLVYRYDVVRNQKQGDADPTFPGNFNDVDSHTAAVRYALWISTRTEAWIHVEYNWTKTKSINLVDFTDPTSEKRNVTANTLLAAVDFAF